MCLSIDALQFNVIICPCPVPFGELSNNIQWNDQHKSTHRHFQAFRAISETIWSRAWSKGCLAVLSNIAKRCCSSRVDLKTNKHIIWNISVSMQFKKGLDKLSNGWTHESLSNEFNWTCFTFEVGFVTAQQLAIMHQCHLPYTFPCLETSATALCGTTGIELYHISIIIFEISIKFNLPYHNTL